MTGAERDINELFDEIVLTEERAAKQSYDEGFAEGQVQGNLEGYKLGYAQGIQLGEELGEIYGFVVAQLQLDTNAESEKVQKSLLQLRKAIDDFPFTNDPHEDIIGKLENIRTLYKLLKAKLRIPSNETEANSEISVNSAVEQKKDYSF